MKDDNTPPIISRRRMLTSKMRLRTGTAKKLQELGSHAKSKRVESMNKTPVETDPGKTDVVLSRIPRCKNNTLKSPTVPKSKFCKRQLHKSWLPTHLYHAKRAHITLPAEPLWRFAIPLTPTDKCYRTTHRASSSRGCVAWDASYMSTIRLEGVETSLLDLLRGLGVEENMLTGRIGAKWRRGTRGWEGWISERDGEKRIMAKIVIMWRISEAPIKETIQGLLSKKKEKREILFRVHPSAFLQVWNEALKVARVQCPQVMVEDLRFEIGSIEIIGPGSTEALIGTLYPVMGGSDDSTLSDDSPEKIWPSLKNVTNPASLPQNALLGFGFSDPRLHHPPQTVNNLDSATSDEKLLHIMSDWPPDTTQISSMIFDRSARFAACKLLPSQKAINRRKGAALPGAYPDPLPKDPQIPVLLMASRSSIASGQGSWTVLLPWKCLLPVWYSLMHYPLSSGGNPRFGGLQEKRQISFEQHAPWFPCDFPGTKAGWDWEVMERSKRKIEWEKRPKGKRIEWESVDLGNGNKGEIGVGWACDWERLFQGQAIPSALASDHPSEQTAVEPKIPAPESQTTDAVESMVATLSPIPPLQIHHIPPPFSTTLLTQPQPPPPTSLTTISLSLLTRGSPTVCARIYRLPTTNSALHQSWLSLLEPIKPAKKPRPQPSLPANALPYQVQAHLASALLGPSQPPIRENKASPPSAGDRTYPPVPGEEDLIGFVTTGNFDLGRGRAMAVGCIALGKVWAGRKMDGKWEGEWKNDGKEEGEGNGKEEGEAKGKGKGNGEGKREGRICIVRDAGQGIGRLAKWEIV